MPNPEPQPLTPATATAYLYTGPTQTLPLTVDGALLDLHLVEGRVVALPDVLDFIPAWLDMGFLVLPQVDGAPGEPEEALPDEVTDEDAPNPPAPRAKTKR